MISLARLEQHAAQATPGPWQYAVTTDGEFGVYRNQHKVAIAASVDAAYLAACDPATVLALTRAAKAALAYDTKRRATTRGDYNAEEAELDAALAPFREQT